MTPEAQKVENAYELTQSQSLIWMGQKLNPDSALYNMAYSFTISGAVDIAVFQRAFQLLIEKMDVFRTVFFERDGVAFQKVLSQYDYQLEVIDLTDRTEAERTIDTDTATYLKERTTRRFDFACPLFDSALIKIKDDRYIWYLNFHHIITDATSSTLIFKKMSEIYGQIRSGDVSEISTSPSFSSYVAYEKEQRKSNRDSVHSYWKSKLTEIQDKPVFYGRKNVEPTHKTRRVSFELDGDTSNNIRRLAKNPEIRALTESLSLFNIFAALLFTYIYRVSGQEKLALGAIAHNRLTRPFKATAGLFIEIFPLVTQLTHTDSFKEVLDRIRMESNNYIRYAQPGMASSEVGRSYNVVLNYINAQFSDFDGLPMKAEWIHPGQSDPTHHIRCHIYDLNDVDNIEINFDLNDHIFDENLFSRIPEHFSNLVKALISEIDEPVVQYPFLTASEKNRLLTIPISSQNEFTSIAAQFEKQVVLRPNGVALQSQDKIYTYKELKKKVDLLADILRNKGIGPAEKVLIHLERSDNYIISLLAVLSTGGAFVPVPRDLPAERVEFILKNSGSSFAITSKDLRKNLNLENFVPLMMSGKDEDIDNRPEIEDIFGRKKNAADSEIDTIYGALRENIIAVTSAKTTLTNSQSIAYILYTSGSTGAPKGVEISQQALANYMKWAGETYKVDNNTVFPLFTSIGFDLTLTSTLLPLLNGGRVVVYPEKRETLDMALMNVMDDNLANIIKLTPSHLTLLQGQDFSSSLIKTMIVGGEDFKVGLAQSVRSAFPQDLKIFNEYGPTEATIGCIAMEFDPLKHTDDSVPIGRPIDHMQAYVLDINANPVPQGVIGELYISGKGLAKGYVKNEEVNAQKFPDNPFLNGVYQHSADNGEPHPSARMYRTGDLARINADGEFEYLGRTDEQIKLRGHRIELAEIESVLANFPGIEQCAVVVVEQKPIIPKNEVVNCSRCGLPSNYPNTDFDENGVCHLCQAFDTYKHKVERYFKNDEELVQILTSKRGERLNKSSPERGSHNLAASEIRQENEDKYEVSTIEPTNSEAKLRGFENTDSPPQSEYDCISLLSGGKDSTYVLARLVNMGLKVLAFTMDNGYISEQAKANVDRIVSKLSVDHIYGETPHMNEIFVDSLHRHHNVCNGCFKTIYTLSTKIALEKNIPFIVTGLSRGQFFETRLTEELFWDDLAGTGTDDSSGNHTDANIAKIDDTILEARKLYHREPDAVKNLLDVSAFESDTIFEKVQFVDFYRYSDVSLEEMLEYLKNKIGWVRPTDTGRSTNCLINQVGIYVHKKEEGYSNYAFPYSWDVRLGHKTRKESLEEINEAIDEGEVHRIMNEIGYDRTYREASEDLKLVAYFTGDPTIAVKELQNLMSKKLPAYMIPKVFKHLDDMPLTPNGKVDKKALQQLNSVQLSMDTRYVAPRNDIEELLEGIWKEVLQLEKIGVHDDFLALGGHSLAAIRVTARINEAIETDFPLNKIFEFPTISEYASYIEKTLTELLGA